MKISVIIPTYNRAALLGEALESVLRQKVDAELDVVVVDDGSTDDTANVLSNYADVSQLRVFTQPNSGQSAARDRGVNESDGELVCFLDSDNRWKPGKLDRQLDVMRNNPEIGVIYGDNELIDLKGKVVGKMQMKRYSGWITRQLLADNFVNFNTSMVRRECIEKAGGFDPSVRIGDDYDLWLRISVHCKFLYVPEIWAEYRVEGDRISGNKDARLESNRKTLNRFLSAHPKIATSSVRSFANASFYTRRGNHRAATGRLLLAGLDYLRALSYRPWDCRPWRGLIRSALLRR